MIAAEPRLSARLLQLANAAAVSPSGRRIIELKTAITRLGRQMVQAAAMAYAVQQLKEAPMLRAIAQPLTDLWRRSIATASICQVIARRTAVPADAAFLAGLLHGIGRLYIMVATMRRRLDPETAAALGELVADWHPAIGHMVLENWEMDGAIAQAVNDQQSAPRHKGREPELTDVLVVAVMLSEILLDGAKHGEKLENSPAFQALALKGEDCGLILTHASYQLDSLMEALAC
jgi:HD-like signal output (HDOD) protein